MSAENQPTPSTAPGATAKRAVTKDKNSASLITGIVFLAILGGGGATWFVLQQSRRTEAAPEVNGPSAPKFLLHLEGFTVNLADSEETHFLRVTMDLGVDHLPDGADSGKKTTLMPVARIRDSILSVLTVCKADSLLSSDGKNQLKKNLVNVLNQNIPELGVREVYFTEFLVQR